MRSRFDQLYKQNKQHINVHMCDGVDCHEVAHYRAPKSRLVPESFTPNYSRGYKKETTTVNNDTYWFCLKHVREYNKEWDFFAYMSGEEIEHFQQDAITGHRPIYQGVKQQHCDSVMDQVWQMFDGSKEQRRSLRYPDNIYSALTILNFSCIPSKKQLKEKYIQLVKKYHPDKGGKKTEEKFKQISLAYQLLKEVVVN